MASLNSPVSNNPFTTDAGLGSTDQGNVTYVVPAMHATFGIPCSEGAFNHTLGFTACAATSEAHDLSIVTSKAMAMAGWRVLSDDTVAESVRRDFESDQKGKVDFEREGW